MIINTKEISNIYIYNGGTDLRNHTNGLCKIIKRNFNLDAKDKSLYVFFNTAKTLMKSIYWDGSGFWLISKKMELGFNINYDNERKLATIDEDTFEWLMQGSAEKLEIENLKTQSVNPNVSFAE